MADFAYTANYCEENIWHLAGEAELHPGVRRVIVVASLGPSVPLWCQRLAPAPDEAVFWDYHVVLAVSGRTRWIYDLDTVLPLPCPLEEYVERTFGPARAEPPLFQPLMRVIEADEYRRSFTSDRSHMRDREGAWLSAPPAWPPLIGAPPAMPLATAIDMRNTSAPGRVCDLDGLLRALHS